MTEKKHGKLLQLRIGESAIKDPDRVAEWLKGCVGRRYDRIRIRDPDPIIYSAHIDNIDVAWS